MLSFFNTNWAKGFCSKNATEKSNRLSSWAEVTDLIIYFFSEYLRYFICSLLSVVTNCFQYKHLHTWVDCIKVSWIACFTCMKSFGTNTKCHSVFCYPRFLVWLYLCDLHNMSLSIIFSLGNLFLLDETWCSVASRWNRLILVSIQHALFGGYGLVYIPF